MYQKKYRNMYWPVFLILLSGLSPSLFDLEAAQTKITANQTETSIAIARDEMLSLSLDLNSASDLGKEADWWLLLQYQQEWLFYATVLANWQPGVQYSYQGALVDLENYPVGPLDTSQLGSYDYYFGVDTLKNGQLDLAKLSYSRLNVNVYEGINSAVSQQPFISNYDPLRACNGTTLLADAHDSQNPRLIEVNMLGQVVWQYDIPNSLIKGNPVGLDAEILANDHVLFNLSNSGIYEIDREGHMVWSHIDAQNSHDVDRLRNGNTLYVFGNNDSGEDSQVKEVDANGQLVWSWQAQNYFSSEEYADISRQGWTHINAVTRMDNGNTLVSLRNFDLSVELNSQGEPVWQFDWRTLGLSPLVSEDEGITDPHEPELQGNDNLLICMQRNSPYRAVEIERSSGQIVWSYVNHDLRTARDCDRLPNGNTLILAVWENGTETDLSDDESVLLELTPDGDVVWQMQLKEVLVGEGPGVFYKAERSCSAE